MSSPPRPAAAGVAILIPARNEEANLPPCLAAALASPAAAIWIADDGSTDGTAALARAAAGADARVRLLSLAAPPPGWAGKNHALWLAAQGAAQPWLLFLDADVRLLPAGLAAALSRAEAEDLAALSLSPEQETGTWAERALLPRLFDLLDQRYPMARVNDPADPLAAGNGQFFLIRRDAYFAVGGHAAIAAEWLEDVALARRLKAAGFAYRFDSGRGLARCRMYRGLGDIRRGFGKNILALFGFPASRRAVATLGSLAWPPAAALLAAGLFAARRPALALLALVAVFAAHAVYARRLRRADRRGSAWLLPANVLVVALWTEAAARARLRRPLTWRGRRPPLPPAHADPDPATMRDADPIRSALESLPPPPSEARPPSKSPA